MKKTKDYGFTIVELVIVIAVIAILSAVLIPTLGGVIEDAQNTSRDLKAKNAYTDYITYHPTEDNSDLFIEIEDGGATYYYSVNDGQIDLDNERKQLSVAPENGIPGNGYVVYLASATEIWLEEWNDIVTRGVRRPEQIYINYKEIWSSSTAHIAHILNDTQAVSFLSFLRSEDIASFGENETGGMPMKGYQVAICDEDGRYIFGFFVDTVGYVYAPVDCNFIRSDKPIDMSDFLEFYNSANKK